MIQLDKVTVDGEDYFVLLRDDRGLAEFLVQIDEDTKYAMNCEVFFVMSWEYDDGPHEIESYLKAYIKWDGCSHITFGEEIESSEPFADGSRPRDGYLHLCGKHYWKLHTRVMEALYKLAEESIEKFDKEVAE